MAQWVKNPLAMPETQVQTLGREDPLKEGVAVLSSVLAWRIPWTEKPGSYSPWRHKELVMTEDTEHACIHARPRNTV